MEAVSCGYRARVIHAVSKADIEDIEDALLVVDSDGRVISCAPYIDGFKGKIVDLTGRLIIPGLVDTHSHIPQLDVRGKHGATLLDWLDRYIFPAERGFSDPKIVEDVAIRFFKKLIINGSTTSSLYSTVHLDGTDCCFEIARAAGVRAIIGKVMMDLHSPDGLIESTSQSLRSSEALCAKWHGSCGGRLRYAFTPRFVPTCSAELFTQLSKLAQDSGAYIQTHIAETREENARVAELFPKCTDYLSFFEMTNALQPRTLLAHAIHLTDSELTRIAKSGAKISHCPMSNFFLKSGSMPASRIEKAGIPYGLGTDVGAGPSMSIFTAMRCADFVQRDYSVSPQRAFFLATMGGAEALSMEHEIGNFEAGKLADFCVVDINGVDPAYRLANLKSDEILSLLMYRGDGRAIEATYVGGKKLDVDFV